MKTQYDEIERKFLVKLEELPDNLTWVPISQNYVRLNGGIVRVRQYGNNFFLAFKDKGTKEVEFALDNEQYSIIKNILGESKSIDKHRAIYKHESHEWEIDRFDGDNEGLVVAEVELGDINEKVDVPSWVGYEVSSDFKYKNWYLSKHPFKSWETNNALFKDHIYLKHRDKYLGFVTSSGQHHPIYKSSVYSSRFGYYGYQYSFHVYSKKSLSTYFHFGSDGDKFIRVSDHFINKYDVDLNDINFDNKLSSIVGLVIQKYNDKYGKPRNRISGKSYSDKVLNAVKNIHGRNFIKELKSYMNEKSYSEMVLSKVSYKFDGELIRNEYLRIPVSYIKKNKDCKVHYIPISKKRYLVIKEKHN